MSDQVVASTDDDLNAWTTRILQSLRACAIACENCPGEAALAKRGISLTAIEMMLDRCHKRGHIREGLQG